MNLDRYIDQIMEKACDICAQPSICISQEDLERQCSICPLEKQLKKTLAELEHATACSTERAVRAGLKR